jgi:cytochrome P450
MEAAMVIATIAQQFRLRAVPDHPVIPIPSFTLRPKHGIRMTLHKRERMPAASSETELIAVRRAI